MKRRSYEVELHLQHSQLAARVLVMHALQIIHAEARLGQLGQPAHLRPHHRHRRRAHRIGYHPW